MITHLLYIDPGSGSYFIQVIVAALVGAAFWIRMSWQRIKAFFSGKMKSRGTKEEDKVV